MQRLLKIPLVFFFLAAAIGLLLRVQHVHALAGFKYPFWLHGHSHSMFLGWIVNALTIGFTLKFLPQNQHPRYVRLITLVNVLLVLMLISFPLQGYGLFSIVFSTLHTVLIGVYSAWFYHDTRSLKGQVAIGFAHLALLFFLISAVGPFALGVLMANGLGYTMWYHLAVYYYLHFQYNGVFTFGALALLYEWLESSRVGIDHSQAKRFLKWLFISCFPAYALSTLWTNPRDVVVFVGGLSAGMQIIAFVFFIGSFRGKLGVWFSGRSLSAKILLWIAVLAFGLKLFLQLLSAHPAIAMLAYDVRNYVMAYIHLVVLGMISFFLLAWYEEQFRQVRIQPFFLFLLIAGFILSEIMLISTGWIDPDIIRLLLLVASLLMTLGIGGQILPFMRANTE